MGNTEHWDNIYKTKDLTEVSWYQPIPTTSLDLINKANISKDSAIIDIGGGDSFLIDNLLNDGYTNLSVLDISVNAINRVKNRLGDKAKLVNWIVTDITKFKPQTKYALWHDRAVFHFLNSDIDILKYKEILNNSLTKNGDLIIGTFSETGPDKCSGINIKKYSKEDLAGEFSDSFNILETTSKVHTTPFNKTQNFSFAHLKYKSC